MPFQQNRTENFEVLTLNAELIANSYLAALEEANLDKVLALFSENAMVISPLYGPRRATEFYPELFEDTSSSKLTLKGVMQGKTTSGETELISIWFHFDWTLADNQPAPFDVVDVLEVDPKSGLISTLHIVYDTFNIRGKFDDSRAAANKPS